MTDDERFALLSGFMALPFGDRTPPRDTWPKDAVTGAGYVPGVPRLNVPSLRETDASLGVTNPSVSGPVTRPRRFRPASRWERPSTRSLPMQGDD